MKKFMLKAILVVALAAVAGYGVYTSQRSQTELSDTALANVEALAEYESLGDCEYYCQSDYRYTCYIIWGSGIDGITCPEYRKKQ